MRDTPVALLTGANKGIGLPIAKELAAHGCTVRAGVTLGGPDYATPPARRRASVETCASERQQR